jgi:hypothetical protein
MIKVPRHRFTQPADKLLSRPPTKLSADFRGVDSVSAVMPGAIGNKSDKVAARFERGIGS